GSALADVLVRIGHLDLDALPAPSIEALAAESTGWRIRTRLAVGNDGRAGLRGRGSSEIITVPCAAPVSGLLREVNALGAAPGTELVLMADADGNRHAAELSAPHFGKGRNRKPGRDQHRRGAQRTRSARSAPRTLRHLEGDELVQHRVGTRTWRIPVNGFWQAHRNAPQVYTATALRMLGAVGITGEVHAWDLYGGAGVFTAALLDGSADHGFTVSSIDLVDSDTDALAAAAVTLGDDAVKAHRGGVADALASLDRPNIVISDPPRTGAGLSVVDGIVAAQPEAIVHVGCDAASFARDVGRFAAQGYRVRAWQGFDAFPMTHHLEAIAILTR
ncbi:MAG: class I SAM-dependent RNA methyltransferase, partial [Gordonia sp. (in: high G+C Gram-positive bacteria)]